MATQHQENGTEKLIDICLYLQYSLPGFTKSYTEFPKNQIQAPYRLSNVSDKEGKTRWTRRDPTPNRPDVDPDPDPDSMLVRVRVGFGFGFCVLVLHFPAQLRPASLTAARHQSLLHLAPIIITASHRLTPPISIFSGRLPSFLSTRLLRANKAAMDASASSLLVDDGG
ncbi:hypothetical protein Droror1_Dr00022981 [Drosera rotundifolia]